MNDTKTITVLLADDETHIRLLMKTVLKSMNAEVVGEAKNGQEAVEQFLSLRPHITLLDINMPQKDGIAALKQIMSEAPEAFVVMMTSVSDLTSVERCLELGAAHYIRKDTPIKELKEMLKQAWVEHRKR